MRRTTLLLICICCLLATSSAWGQEAKHSHPGILGYLDPQTGAFRPMPAPIDDVEAPAATVFGGTITVTLTITVKSVSITSITCSASTSVSDGSAGFWSEGDTVSGTGTGTTRTCKMTIPYSWGLVSGATDFMSTGYSVIATGGTATSINERLSSHSPLDTRKVPANGATTALTANVTI